MLLNLEDFPPNVMRLAAGCMLHSFTVPLLMKASPEHAAVFASVCGLTFDEMLEAVDWFSAYIETHPPCGMLAN